MEQPEKRCLQISPYLFENQTGQKYWMHKEGGGQHREIVL